MRLFRSILAFAAALAAAAPAAAATLVGGTTSVTLTAAPTLVDLGLTIAPIGTATIDTDGEFPVARFPITAATTDDGGNAIIFHSGSGLAFSSDDALLEIGDFVIDTLALRITGFARANGSLVGFLPLFTLDDSLNVFLSAEAAGAFSSLFGAPDLTGVQIGTAAIAPVPEPQAWALMIGGFLIVGAAMRRRSTPVAVLA